MISFLSSYLLFNLLLILGFVSLFGLQKLKFSARGELEAHYQILAASLAVTVVQYLWPVKQVFEPIIRVWTAPSRTAIRNTVDRGFLAIGDSVPIHTENMSWMPETVRFLGFLLLVSVVFFLAKSVFRLVQIVRQSILIRKIGRVRVFIHSDSKVPFSFWLPGFSVVMMPMSLVGTPNFKTAIFHELQHHRQGDTRWLFAMFFIRGLCLANPVVHVWSRWLTQLQEFACDEALIERRKVQSTDYARCLVEVAETAINPQNGTSVQCRSLEIPESATGFLLWRDRTLLKRRIHKMFEKKTTDKKVLRQASIAAVLFAMVGTAYAAKGSIQDRRVNITQAESMAKKVPGDASFPVVVNKKVLTWLNYYIGTPEGRLQMKNALQRMQDYRPLVDQAIEEYGVPENFRAIPIIESAYQNKPESNVKGRGAGLWMFIKSTARAYGLRVNETVDERLNVTLETDAAMRYLSANKHRFKDWALSVLAYNVGENYVQQAINESGTRDAWELVRLGYENDHDYLPKLMAAIIVMHNPDSVN